MPKHISKRTFVERMLRGGGSRTMPPPPPIDPSWTEYTSHPAAQAVLRYMEENASLPIYGVGAARAQFGTVESPDWWNKHRFFVGRIWKNLFVFVLDPRGGIPASKAIADLGATGCSGTQVFDGALTKIGLEHKTRHKRRHRRIEDT